MPIGLFSLWVKEHSLSDSNHLGFLKYCVFQFFSTVLYAIPSVNLIWWDYASCKRRFYLIPAWILPVDTISLQKYKVNKRAPFVAWLSVSGALVTGIIHRFPLSVFLVSATEVLSLLLKWGIIFLPKECVYLIFFSKLSHLAAACRSFTWNPHLHFKKRRYLSDPFERHKRPASFKHQWTQIVNRTSATMLFYVKKE